MDEPSDIAHPRDTDAEPAAVAAPALIRLRLYICLPTPTSIRAAVNLKAVLDGLGPDAAPFVLETIDLLVEPLRALRDRVIVTPTLLVTDRDDIPPVVGDLSDAGLVRAFLERALRGCGTRTR